MGPSALPLGLPACVIHCDTESKVSQEPSHSSPAFAHAAVLNDKQGSPLAGKLVNIFTSELKNRNGLTLAPDLEEILRKQDVGLQGNCFLFDFLG